ncbi:MAG TPA: polysaccharide biosynthesis tyrosine autokinase, partial [Gemmatimonadales bacterium]|nr:polysaccharide biosynthesis tyrosine autokinase [Gemmatimonadales bacterium]
MMVQSMRPDSDPYDLPEASASRFAAGSGFLRDPWGAIRRNLLIIAGSTAVLVGATWYYTSRMIPVYQATTSIRIDEKQSQLPALDILRMNAGNELDTEMEMLRSRTLAEDVTDSLDFHLQLVTPTATPREWVLVPLNVPRDATPGSYALQRRPDGKFRVADRATDSTVAEVAPGGQLNLGGAEIQLTTGAAEYETIEFDVLDFEDAVSWLNGSTAVSRPKREASLVDVTFEGVDPIMVRDVANLLASRFIEARRNVQQTETRSTVTFLQEQLAKLTGELAGAEDALKDFREREQVVSLRDEASSGVVQLADVRAQRNSIEAERVALTRFLDQVRASRARGQSNASSPFRELAAFPTLLRNSATVNLLSSLAATEAERAEKRPNATDLDPDMQVLNRRRTELENQLEQISLTYLQGLGAQVAALDSGIAASQRKLDDIPRRELKYARLDREAKTLEQIVTLLQSRLKEAEIAQAVSDPSVRQVDPALTPKYPVRPNKPLNLALALVAGLTLGLAAAFLREFRDKSVHTRKDVLFATGAPVLGLIPHARSSRGLRSRNGGHKSIAAASVGGPRSKALRRGPARAVDPGRLLLPGVNRQTPLAEAHNSLATNLAFARPDSPPRLLVVTSPTPGDGKTTTAINLAITHAERGRKVLLVDADLRRGVVSSLLGLNRTPGLSTLLGGKVDHRDLVQVLDLENGSRREVLTTGP